jgi:hypothetical protein
MQDVFCEVIVATPGRHTVDMMLDGVGAEPNVRVLAGDVAGTAPGLLRNLAAAHATAPRLSLSDADIVPLGTDFLRRAIALAGADVVPQPWMHRLAPIAGQIEQLQSLKAPDRSCCFVRAASDGSLHPAGDERFRTKRSSVGKRAAA